MPTPTARAGRGRGGWPELGRGRLSATARRTPRRRHSASAGSPGLGRSTGASSRSSLRPPAAGLLRPAGSQGEAHRVHPRPGGDPEDPAASAAARAARPRCAARLRSLTRHAVPWRVRGRPRRPGCVRRGNTREAGSLGTPIRGRHGGACRRMSGPARSLPAWGAATGDPSDPCAPLRWPVR